MNFIKHNQKTGQAIERKSIAEKATAYSPNSEELGTEKN